MSKVLVEESNLTAIAGAIRQKLGVQTTYKPGQMATAIGQIHGEPVLETLTANANGSYTPSTGKDGFSAVTVNVPNSYFAEDEGKVVSSGALVAQTARASEITSNGTYDTTNNNSVTVNVSGGGSNSWSSGSTLPDDSRGSNGDLYLYTSNMLVGDKTNGGTYIDSGYKPTGKTKVEMKVSDSTDTSTWFGCWNTSWNSGAFGLFNDRFGYGVFVGYANNGGTSGTVADAKIHVVELDKGIARIDGTTVRTYTQNNSYTATNNLLFFANNQSESVSRNAAANQFNLYYCKIYEDGVLVRHYVPALGANDAPCLYEQLTETYFYNAGSGSFSIAQGDITIYEKVNNAWVVYGQ